MTSEYKNSYPGYAQSCHKFCPKYIVTQKENETEHPLFEANNLLAIVLSFYL